MIKKIAIIVVLLIVGVLAFATTRPDSLNVERTARINAPPEKIFPYINDFHRWTDWSPYEKVDPAMKRTYSGSASGKGAVYEWEGNWKAGKGRMEIVDAPAPRKVGIQLDFLKPMEQRNTAEFNLKPVGGSTEVTWSMRGPTAYPTKVIGMFVSMDRMIGKDFDTGLANLKAVAEK